MGTFNILVSILTCPYCQRTGRMEIEFKFGLKNLDRYFLGDKLRWDEKDIKNTIPRPNNGNYNGDGYVECPYCARDFWVNIQVKNDVINNIDININKAGYIPKSPSRY